jgi:UDP-N-acetylmuramyl pentapeptide phosphotransferase/UDP-N-acetylglucosamine-1-phosphate transferase
VTGRVRPVLLAPALAATAAAAARRLLDSRTGPGWRRLNYRGTTVTLSAGPAAALGLLVGIAGARPGDRAQTAAAVAVSGAAVAGFVDDRASARADERAVKGFAGHLGALAQGKASSGAVKMALIGSTSLAAAVIRTGANADTVLDAALVAGSANLVNLLDLRPGRAVKVAGGLCLVLVPGARGGYQSLLATTAATLAVSLPPDLAERSMLGDTGANALGAAVGSVLCGRRRRVRLLALAVVAGLTAASEKVSFTAVIAANPVLRRLDELGRTGG